MTTGPMGAVFRHRLRHMVSFALSE